MTEVLSGSHDSPHNNHVLSGNVSPTVPGYEVNTPAFENTHPYSHVISGNVEPAHVPNGTFENTWQPPLDPTGERTLSGVWSESGMMTGDGEYTSLEAEALKNHERVPLDYRQLVEGDDDIVMFGENHYHTAVLDSIAQNASVLSKAGIRAFLLEASSEQDYSDINHGDFTRLDNDEVGIGPDLRLMSQKKYRELGVDYIANARINMIKALVSQGIAIVPVDSAKYHTYVKDVVRAHNEKLPYPEGGVSQPEREQDMAENIDAAVAQYGRVAGLFGKSHVRKGELININGQSLKETAQYAAEHGHSVRTIHFYGSELYEGEARKRDPYLTENGWGDHEYMYRPAADDPIAKAKQGDNPDWIVYIPPNKFEYEYGPAYLNEVSTQER